MEPSETLPETGPNFKPSTPSVVDPNARGSCVGGDKNADGRQPHRLPLRHLPRVQYTSQRLRATLAPLVSRTRPVGTLYKIAGEYTEELGLDKDGKEITVDVATETGKLLDRFARWVNQAPECKGCSHWHILTDCMPAIPGNGITENVGLAESSSSCKRLVGRPTRLGDSGNVCDNCEIRLKNGNAATAARARTAAVSSICR